MVWIIYIYINTIMINKMFVFRAFWSLIYTERQNKTKLGLTRALPYCKCDLTLKQLMEWIHHMTTDWLTFFYRLSVNIAKLICFYPTWITEAYVFAQGLFRWNSYLIWCLPFYVTKKSKWKLNKSKKAIKNLYRNI